MDLSKLKPADWMVGGGTLVFLIAMFLPWYKAEVSGFEGGSATGLDYGLFGIIPLLLLLAVAGATVLPKLVETVKVPETIGPLPRAQGALAAAGLATVLVLLRILIKDDGGVPAIFQDEIDISRGIGLFLAFLASAAVTAGAFLIFQGKEDLGGGASSQPPTPF